MASLYIAKWQVVQNAAGSAQNNGGKLAFTLTTTTTNKSTYPTEADAIAGTNANPNPVILDSDGRSPVEIWLSGRYRLRTYTSADVLIADDDPIEDFVPASSSQADTTTFGGNNSGTANALVFTYSPALTSYTNGQQLSGRILADNTAAVTVNGGGGVKSLVKQDGTALVAGDLQGPGIITFAFDFTSDNMRLQSADGYLFRNGGNEPARVDVADGATINLTPSVINSRYARLITSATAITAITLPDGNEADVLFNTIRTLTNNASVILPGGANITTAVGDTMQVRGESGAIVRVVNYTRANGAPVYVGDGTYLASHFLLSTTDTGTTRDIALPAGYSSYEIVMSGVQPVTDNAFLWAQVSVDSGSTYLGGTSYAFESATRDTAGTSVSVGSVGAAKFELLSGTGIDTDAAASTLSGTFEIHSPANTTFHKGCFWKTAYTRSDGAYGRTEGAGIVISTSAVTHVRFLMSTGDIQSGTFKLYGIK